MDLNLYALSNPATDLDNSRRMCRFKHFSSRWRQGDKDAHICSLVFYGPNEIADHAGIYIFAALYRHYRATDVLCVTLKKNDAVDARVRTFFALGAGLTINQSKRPKLKFVRIVAEHSVSAVNVTRNPANVIVQAALKRSECFE